MWLCCTRCRSDAPTISNTPTMNLSFSILIKQRELFVLSRRARAHTSVDRARTPAHWINSAKTALAHKPIFRVYLISSLSRSHLSWRMCRCRRCIPPPVAHFGMITNWFVLINHVMRCAPVAFIATRYWYETQCIQWKLHIVDVVVVVVLLPSKLWVRAI